MADLSSAGVARGNKRRGVAGQGGFTVIELLIITVVIAIIASIALPNYVNSKKAANETSAINSMRALVVAQENYRVAKNGAGYTDLTGLKNSKLVNPALGSGAMSGYTFIVQGVPGSSTFAFKGIPQDGGGDRYFYVDQTGVLRASDDASIDANSPPLK